MAESKHCINVLNPERHGGDGLNASYISYEITSLFVSLLDLFYSCNFNVVAVGRWKGVQGTSEIPRFSMALRSTKT